MTFNFVTCRVRFFIHSRRIFINFFQEMSELRKGAPSRADMPKNRPEFYDELKYVFSKNVLQFTFEVALLVAGTCDCLVNFDLRTSGMVFSLAWLTINVIATFILYLSVLQIINLKEKNVWLEIFIEIRPLYLFFIVGPIAFFSMQNARHTAFRVSTPCAAALSCIYVYECLNKIDIWYTNIKLYYKQEFTVTDPNEKAEIIDFGGERNNNNGRLSSKRTLYQQLKHSSRKGLGHLVEIALLLTAYYDVLTIDTKYNERFMYVLQGFLIYLGVYSLLTFFSIIYFYQDHLNSWGDKSQQENIKNHCYTHFRSSSFLFLGRDNLKFIRCVVFAGFIGNMAVLCYIEDQCRIILFRLHPAAWSLLALYVHMIVSRWFKLPYFRRNKLSKFIKEANDPTSEIGKSVRSIRSVRSVRNRRARNN